MRGHSVQKKRLEKLQRGIVICLAGKDPTRLPSRENRQLHVRLLLLRPLRRGRSNHSTRTEATATGWGASKVDTHHRHEGDRQTRQQQQRSFKLKSHMGASVTLESTNDSRTWRHFTVGGEAHESVRRLLLQGLSFQFHGDMSAELSSLARLGHDCEVQSRKAVDGDLNTARLGTWIKTRDEILEFARDSTSTHNQRQGKGQRKENGKAKATPPPQPPSPQAETRQPSKAKAKAKSPATEKECFHCTQKTCDIVNGRRDLTRRKGGQWLLQPHLMRDNQRVPRPRHSLALCHESANPRQ